MATWGGIGRLCTSYTMTAGYGGSFEVSFRKVMGTEKLIVLSFDVPAMISRVPLVDSLDVSTGVRGGLYPSSYLLEEFYPLLAPFFTSTKFARVNSRQSCAARQCQFAPVSTKSLLMKLEGSCRICISFTRLRRGGSDGHDAAMSVFNSGSTLAAMEATEDNANSTPKEDAASFILLHWLETFLTKTNLWL